MKKLFLGIFLYKDIQIDEIDINLPFNKLINMLSKSLKKYITSLNHKKYRKQFNTFCAEGDKLNHDLILSEIQCTELLATFQWMNKNRNLPLKDIKITEVSESELRSISNLKSPPPVIGIYKIAEHPLKVEKLSGSLVLALDGVQDPGNMGTIIRIADWFGINNIICSEESADIYNPKVVQASMGAIARVAVHYTNLNTLIEEYKQKTKLPVYGTFLEGENIYSQNLSKSGMIVMGSEGKGISPKIEKTISDKLFIPSFPSDESTSESLNVSVATAVVCSEFRRREI